MTADTAPNIIGIIIFGALVGLIPFFVVTMTAFLKLSVVMFLIRNALGVQQTPPSIVLYGIALILTVYVTSPLIGDVAGRLSARPISLRSVEDLTETANLVRQPIQLHLARFAQ